MRVMNRAIAAPVNAAVSTAQVFPSINSATAPAALVMGGGGKYAGKTVMVRASGSATTVDANTTVLISLYAVKNGVPSSSPLAVASYTLLQASSARVVNASTVAWRLEAALIWDATGKLVHGTCKHVVNNTVDAEAALTNALALDDGDADPTMTLVCAITFGVNAKNTNVGKLLEFVAGY